MTTGDLVYMLGRMGFETGVMLDDVVEAAYLMGRILGRPPAGRPWQRLRGRS
jgi:hypothetical protein